MSAPRDRGLGRGLGALIPQRTPPPQAGPLEVPIDKIKPNPHQPRTRFDDSALQELAQSIREHGLLQPVIVSRTEEGYELIAGERRWRAARLAGLEAVPVVVKETTARNSLELALVENIQRRDLNPIEEAHAYRTLMVEHGLTQEQLGQRIGRGRVLIANTLRLLRLPADVQQAVAEGDVSEGHARAIARVEEADDQVSLLERVLREGMSVRETEKLAEIWPNVSEPQRRPTTTAGEPDRDVARVEEAFRRVLGTKVQLVRKGRNGGRLVVHFYSDDELQGLYHTIARRTLDL